MIQGSNDEDEYILHARCSEHGAFGREWACPRCFEEIQAWGEEIKARLARLERIEEAAQGVINALTGKPWAMVPAEADALAAALAVTEEEAER